MSDVGVRKGVPGFPYKEILPVDCSDHFMADMKVKIDSDGRAIPDYDSKIDLDAMTQTYKDQCGMELAQRLLKLGQADASDFADDGNGGYDYEVVPDTPQARANAAVAAKKQADAVKQAYGIDPAVNLTQEQFDALIKSYIEANIDKFVAPKADSVDGGAE